VRHGQEVIGEFCTRMTGKWGGAGRAAGRVRVRVRKRAPGDRGFFIRRQSSEKSCRDAGQTV